MQTSHSPYRPSVNLLQAAAAFVGGGKQPDAPLGIAQPLLGRLIADLHHAPDPLLLWAEDIVLAHRQSPIPLAATRTFGLAGIPA